LAHRRSMTPRRSVLERTLRNESCRNEANAWNGVPTSTPGTCRAPPHRSGHFRRAFRTRSRTVTSPSPLEGGGLGLEPDRMRLHQPELDPVLVRDYPPSPWGRPTTAPRASSSGQSSSRLRPRRSLDHRRRPRGTRAFAARTCRCSTSGQ
jgi:hypothetical protein